jgi:hypothetical protein
MKQRIAVAMAVVALVASGCGTKKKVELVYDEPVTTVWTDRPLPPGAVPGSAPAVEAQPAQSFPAAGAPSAPPALVPASAPAPSSTQGFGAAPTATPGFAPAPTGVPGATQAAPAAAPSEPQPVPAAVTAPAPPYPTESAVPPGAAPGHPRMPGTAQQPPPPPPSNNAWRNNAPPTGFPDESVTTFVVPDPNPTTQTTLKRKSGWVRGGYD